MWKQNKSSGLLFINTGATNSHSQLWWSLVLTPPMQHSPLNYTSSLQFFKIDRSKVLWCKRRYSMQTARFLPVHRVSHLWQLWNKTMCMDSFINLTSRMYKHISALKNVQNLHRGLDLWPLTFWSFGKISLRVFTLHFSNKTHTFYLGESFGGVQLTVIQK